jgi:hypothetical protein
MLRNFDFSTVPFGGYDKTSNKSFRYDLSHVMPPDIIYFVGKDLSILNCEMSIGFGGTVSPISEAFLLTQFFASACIEFSKFQFRGVPSTLAIVSGGAIGIDLAAHLTTTSLASKTIAVVATEPSIGLRGTLPVASVLTDAILRSGGAIVSEYKRERNVTPMRVAERDRIISGLSDVFVAVESSKDSGTVDTAKRAWIQGKTVVVVDWGNIEGVVHKPQTDGLAQLVSEGVAISFPSIKVGLGDKLMRSESLNLLQNVTGRRVSFVK